MFCGALIEISGYAGAYQLFRTYYSALRACEANPDLGYVVRRLVTAGESPKHPNKLTASMRSLITRLYSYEDIEYAFYIQTLKALWARGLARPTTCGTDWYLSGSGRSMADVINNTKVNEEAS